MKKFINVRIYENDDAIEILVQDGKIKEIGNNLVDGVGRIPHFELAREFGEKSIY